ncbi:MAG TPA: DUF6161 domain-containing protein [Phycisphaerales bacterium]|nr:DUF6161 domain-containing protein [Phycisphaerales bacterium]
MIGRAGQPHTDLEWRAAWLVARRNRVTDGTVQTIASKLSIELRDLQTKKAAWLAESAEASTRAASTATALNEQLQQIDVLRERSKTELAAEVSKGISEHKEAYQQAAAAAAAAGQALTDDLKKRTDEIAATYRSHMALKAPVTYWEAKRRVHRAKAKMAMSAFFWSLTVAAFTLPVLSWVVLPSESEWPKLPLARIGMLAIVVTLVFWGLRIIARLMLSHLHLTNDAAERTVMVKSYLALRTEGALSDGKGDETILKSLFRSAGTGIAKEDAHPRPFFVEIAKNG